MSTTYQTPAGAEPDLSSSEGQKDTGEELVERARKLGPKLREHSDEAERSRRLSKQALEVLAAGGFHSLMTPRSLGGLEVDPVTCARVVEEVASADSAAAWSLQSPNVNVWWASRLPDQGVAEIYGSNPSTMVAAAFHPPQQAVEVPGGYRVSGRAPLASMIHDCDWILFGAFIMDGGQPRMTPFGPAMIAVILPTADVEIIDTWHTLGMRGTDSHDAAFQDVFVPAHLTFPFTPDFEPGRHFQGPLYRFPAVAIIALFSVAVLMASARGAVSEFRELAQRKVAMGSMKTLRDRGTVQSKLAEAEGILRSARAFFYETFGEAWERTAAGQPHTLEQRADLLLAGIHAARSSAGVTDLMHQLAGTTGIYSKSRLDRHFRDAHTLRHHAFVSESKLESVGQIYLGLPPEFPLLAF